MANLRGLYPIFKNTLKRNHKSFIVPFARDNIDRIVFNGINQPMFVINASTIKAAILAMHHHPIKFARLLSY